jgi:hypothetical protein
MGLLVLNKALADVWAIFLPFGGLGFREEINGILRCGESSIQDNKMSFLRTLYLCLFNASSFMDVILLKILDWQ